VCVCVCVCVYICTWALIFLETIATEARRSYNEYQSEWTHSQTDMSHTLQCHKVTPYHVHVYLMVRLK